MPNFRYQSLTPSGQERRGVVSASDRAEAVRQLISRGETATSVEPEDAAARPTGIVDVLRNGSSTHAVHPESRTGFQSALSAISLPRFSLRRSRPSLRKPEMASLMRELATALEAGLPLMQSLRTVRRQASGKAMPVILDHLIRRVEAGDPLHVAARDYGPPFDDMIVGMLRAADASGKMSEVLHQLADLLERSVELRREVLGATLYPMIVAGLADLLTAYWIFGLVGLGLAWFAWRTWVRIPANRSTIDRVKLQLPLVGRLLRDVAVARFTRTLGTLISAGLPILDAIRITRNTLANAALMEAMDQVHDQITSGKSLADPLDRSGLFPPLLVQVVNMGERSGRLESMLLHAAGAFDRQVATSIKLFTKALPPLLLIIMAAIGGFVLSAILLPLLELQSLVK